MTFFFVGLDGATYKVIDKLVEEGELPNFKKIMEEGSYGVLEATYPPSTFPGWPTIATGLNPGKHGVFGFFNPDKRFPLVEKKTSISDADYIGRQLKKVETLWGCLGQKGKVCSINFPGTYPPKKVNGVMVGGLLTPSISGNFTYPHDLKEEIDKAIDNYEIDAKFQVNKKKALENVNRVAKKRWKLLKHFMEEKDFDNFAVVFTSLDRIQHYLWGCREVEEHYKLLDGFLGEIMEKADNLVVVSDHGFQKNEKYFYINNWLREKGFLKIKKMNKLSLNYILRFLGVKKSNILKLIKFFKLTFLLKLLPMKFKGVLPENKVSIEEVDIDWEKTKAYAIYSMENGVYLNLKGREPQGSVSEKEYEEVRKKIMEGIESEFDIKCLKKEEVYGGSYLENFPDIILDIKEEGLRFNSSLGEKVVEKIDHRETESPLGFHHKDGIFMAFGKDVRKKKLERLEQVDVLPTIKHLFGMKLSKKMDGQVVKEIFKEDSEAFKRELSFEEEDVVSGIKI